MAKYNIYKIKNGRVRELSEHLVSDRQYKVVSSNTLNGYSIFTYFAGPDDANMWWLEQYGDLFFDSNVTKHNQIYSGAIIASKNNSGYILPFGKTHFYIQEFIEYNFGLEMAEKIADPNQAKMKSLKRFGGKTSKSLISYTSGSSLDFSSGDSAEYLKLRPQNTDVWGTSFIHFGTSIQFGSLDIEPSDLGNLLQRIDSANNSRRKFEIPLMRQIKDEAKIISLYQELGNRIMNNEGEIGLVDYEIYGTDFIFSQQTHVRLKYDRIKSNILTDLTTTDIVNFAQNNEINLETSLTKFKVQIIVDGQSKYTTQLLNLIEYHSDKERVFLYRGKWFTFNQSFIEQLHKSLAKISLQKFTQSFSELEFQKWKKRKTKGIKYRERFVIEKIESIYGYNVYDREMEYIPYGGKTYQIEVGDVYDSAEKRMFVVKIGEPKDFGYAFDQAMIVLHNMTGNTFPTANSQNIEIEKMVILLLFKTERNLKQITDTKSLIFELKLDELRKLAIEKNVKLEVQYSTIT